MEFKYPMADNEVLRKNYFKDWSLNELRNLWPQMKFFYANGFTEEGTVLDVIRKEYNDRCEPGMGLIMLEKDYLTAVAIKSFCGCKDCKYEPYCPGSIHCDQCSRMYSDHYACNESGG